MKQVVQQIPNLLTLSNLLCGCLAIKFALEWDLVMAAYLVGLAAVFDFFDGFAARLLKVSGEMGKQLDSLADLVSFGVVPGIIMFQMIRISILSETEGTHLDSSNVLNFISFIAFLIPLFSAYRLAKFNLDTRQTDKFIGLPTPANAIFICSLGIIMVSGNKTPEYSAAFYFFEQFKLGVPDSVTGYFSEFSSMELAVVQKLLFNHFNLALITLFFSILLIAELPLFALKFKNFGWADNKIRYIFLTISLAMLIIFQVIAIPFIVILYLLLSIVNNLIFKQ